MKIRLEGTLEFSNRVLGYAKVRRYSGRLSGLGGYGCACALADLRSSDYRWIAGIAVIVGLSLYTFFLSLYAVIKK